MSLQKTIGNREFVRRLKEGNGGFNSQVVITDHINLDCDRDGLGEINHISIQGATFTGQLSFKGFMFGEREESIRISGCSVLGGLRLENCNGKDLCLSAIEAKYVNFGPCDFRTASLTKLKVPKDTIDLSGLNVVRHLVLTELTFRDFMTYDKGTFNVLCNVQRVFTDNRLISEMFRLMGVPVFVRASVVKKWLEENGAADRGLALASPGYGE